MLYPGLGSYLIFDGPPVSEAISISTAQIPHFQRLSFHVFYVLQPICVVAAGMRVEDNH